MDKHSKYYSQIEFGDWQTNMDLALSICEHLKKQGEKPQVVIEPTCGKGNFIIAALKTFDTIEAIYGIDINKTYLEELQATLSVLNTKGVDVKLINDSVFNVNFSNLCGSFQNKNVLIIGNPPWVTNSKLGELDSKNLPVKHNLKGVKGLNAITGKSNFDIAESICYNLISSFSSLDMKLSLLLKTSVIKNIVHCQKSANLPITEMKEFLINADKEFGVSVSAALFTLKIDRTSKGQSFCEVFDFYTKQKLYSFGWSGDKFVSNFGKYQAYSYIDGKSPLVWWSGLKHDCAKVMELSRRGNDYINGFGEYVEIESEVLYPLLKSSDIKGGKIENVRKYVILTQHNTREDTTLIRQKYPKAYSYLISHSEYLDGRKSTIYRNRPRFCLFGIGEYSFKPYKIAVSGLYKEPLFSLTSAINNKVILLDDTCYQRGFDSEQDAKITLKLLNSSPVQKFIKSLYFEDTKRPINKDLLMRIDLLSACRVISAKELEIREQDYELYKEMLMKKRRVMQQYLF